MHNTKSKSIKIARMLIIMIVWLLGSKVQFPAETLCEKEMRIEDIK